VFPEVAACNGGDGVNVYVKRLDTQEVVTTIPLRRPPSLREHKRFLMGLIRNMGAQFYVDDSEVVCSDERVTG